MKVEIDNTTMGVIIVVLIVVFYCWIKNQEKWTQIAGGEQEWKPMIGDPVICDTGFNDDQCKYSAINCLNNPHSSLYKA